MPELDLSFASPRKLPRPRDLRGAVAVLDIAFASEAGGKSFETVTLPFIEGLGPRLVASVDHHDSDHHVDYRGDERFVLHTKAEHGACPEIVTPELVRRALAGQRVVRLKGGDPLVFGRGGEEIEALREAGVRFEIVPGVTAAAGCAAAAAIPLTHRDHARTLILVTGHTKDGEPELNWQALCQPGQTLVFYMGHKALGRLCARLIEHGLPAALPAALIENGTLPEQRQVTATLDTLAAAVARLELRGPALVVIGEVAAFAEGGPDGRPPGPQPLQRADNAG